MTRQSHMARVQAALASHRREVQARREKFLRVVLLNRDPSLSATRKLRRKRASMIRSWIVGGTRNLSVRIAS